MISTTRTTILLQAAATLAFALTLSGCDNSSASTPSSSPAATTSASSVQTASADVTQDFQHRACAARRWGSPQLSFCATQYTVAQAAGSVSLIVTRSGNSNSAISVDYATVNGSAVAGKDYTAESGVLSWAENDSTTKTIAVPVNNASAFSGDKTFTVVLSKPSAQATIGSPGTATVTIAGDATAGVGTLEFADDAYTASQAAQTVTISVDRAAGAVGATSVAYATSNGTAVAGTDFTAASGTLDWAAGDSTPKSFTVSISNATPFSGTKTFAVALSKASAGAQIGTPQSTTVSIVGDKSAAVGTLELAAPTYSTTQSAGSVAVKVNRTGGSSGAVSVSYATANGSAVAGVQYTAASGTLKWADGDTTAKSFAVPVSNATPFTGNKTFTVALASPSAGATISSPGAATVAIAGDASAPAGNVQLSVSSYTVAQNGGSVLVTVDRTGGSSGAVGVAYATANGTALAGTDYTASQGTLNWADGDAAAKSFSIPISNATPFSGTKSFTIALSAPSGGAAVVSPSSATVAITGDAAAAVGSLQLSAAAYTVAQSAGSLTVTVNRTGGSSGAVTVAYALVNGTAVAGTDFTATAGTLTWAAGNAASQSFSIPISDKTPFSGSKTFRVQLASPGGGATLASLSAATVTITGAAVAASTSTHWVYYNGVFNWPGDWSWQATVNYNDTAGGPLEGPYDIAVRVTSGTGGWQPYVSANCQTNSSECFDTTPYKYLIFSLKPTVPDAVWAVNILSQGDTADGDSVVDISAYGPSGGPVVGQWGSYKIPLSVFHLTDTTILKFSIQDQSGPALYYVDNVGFSVN